MMRNTEIIERCTNRLGMSTEEAEWVARNLYNYEVPDWSEWTWRQIDECFKGVLWFKGKTETEIAKLLGCEAEFGLCE